MAMGMEELVTATAVRVLIDEVKRLHAEVIRLTTLYELVPPGDFEIIEAIRRIYEGRGDAR